MSKKLTLYENGVLSICDVLTLNNEENEYSIKANKKSVNDVISSLSVNARLSKYPEFSLRSNGDFQFSSVDLLSNLAKHHQGVSLEISYNENNKAKGILLSYDELDNKHGEKEYKVWIKEGQSILPIGSRQISNIEILDETLNQKISDYLEKTIKQNNDSVQNIRFSIAKDDKESCQVKYFVPNSAWKISYRFYSIDGKSRLDALAIVDNNTEEDWENVHLSVATGSPFLFNSNLDAVKTARRVSLARNMTPVVASASMDSCAGQFSTMSGDVQYSANDLEHVPEQAIEEESSGDMKFFDCPNQVSLESKKSSTIPLFHEEFKDSEVVYLDFSITHGQNALYFKVTDTTRLMSGICTIYKNSRYIGSSQIEKDIHNRPIVAKFADQKNIFYNQEKSEIDYFLKKIEKVDGNRFKFHQDIKTNLHFIFNNNSQKNATIVFRTNQLDLVGCENFKFEFENKSITVKEERGDCIFDLDESKKEKAVFSYDSQSENIFNSDIQHLFQIMNTYENIRKIPFFNEAFKLYDEMVKLKSENSRFHSILESQERESKRLAELLSIENKTITLNETRNSLIKNENKISSLKDSFNNNQSRIEEIINTYNSSLEKFKDWTNKE